MPLAFDDVERLASALPGVNRGTSYGTPCLRVGKRFMPASGKTARCSC